MSSSGERPGDNFVHLGCPMSRHPMIGLPKEIDRHSQADSDDRRPNESGRELLSIVGC